MPAPQEDQQVGARSGVNRPGNPAVADGSDPAGRDREQPYSLQEPQHSHSAPPQDGAELAQLDMRAIAGEREFEGLGATVRCSLNRVTFRWANDSVLTLKFDQVIMKVEFHRLPAQKLITLEVAVRMNMDPPLSVANGANIVIAFPESDAAKVESLAERLRSMAVAVGSDPGPVPGSGQATRPQAGAVESRSGAPQSRQGGAEARPKTADSKAPASPPGPVRVRAGLASWADEQSWLVLYPTKETERLLVVSPPSQAGQADRKQGT